MSGLAVVGVGLATSVGSSAVAAVAALRAGVARFAEVADIVLAGRGGASASHAIAARSPLHTRRGVPPSQRLFQAALADAGTQATSHTWEVHAGRWAVPDGPEALATTVYDAPGLTHTPLVTRLGQIAGHPGRLSGPYGLVGVDLLTAPDALAHFRGQGRLKPAAPSGLVPGDAAAAVVVEPLDAARAAGRAVLATVEAWGVGTEAVPLGGAEPSRADGLTRALADAFPDGSAPPDLVVADLNGERARALEWALAAPRALPPWEGHLPVRTPADGAGDTGVAAGGVLVAYAALALAWGDADRALVVASDDGGARAALVLHAADRLPPRAAA